MTTDEKLRIAAWDESTVRELDAGQRITRATVTLGESGDPLTGTFTSDLHYRADGTSTFVTLLHLTGTIADRTGELVLTGHGTYDGTTAAVRFEVVTGSGTGELAGVGGTAISTTTHADYPLMPLRLDLTPSSAAEPARRP